MAGENSNPVVQNYSLGVSLLLSVQSYLKIKVVPRRIFVLKYLRTFYFLGGKHEFITRIKMAWFNLRQH
jgi:hypothetical protein